MANLRVEALVHPVSAGESVYRWHLLARNGRALGCGRETHAAPADVLTSFVQVCVHADQLGAQFHHSDSDTAWTWSLTLLGEVVVDASRTYGRRGTCAAACSRFVQTVSAVSTDDVLGRAGEVLSEHGLPLIHHFAG